MRTILMSKAEELSIFAIFPHLLQVEQQGCRASGPVLCCDELHAHLKEQEVLLLQQAWTVPNQLRK